MRPTRVLVFGTFDILHAGHRSFLRQAARIGTELVAAVGRDAVVRKLKGRRPIQSESKRRLSVSRLPEVDRAVLASKNPAQRFEFIRRIGPDVIALGYDQTFYTDHLRSELRRRGIRCRVVRLRAYRAKQFKSSLLRTRLAHRKKS